MSTWVRLLRVHASTTRAFNAELLAEHGLTLNDFEALLHLSRAEEGRMRRVDLAENLLLTASGVTRLLDGLEAHDLVERAACASDRRVVYAVITDEGRAALADQQRQWLTVTRALSDVWPGSGALLAALGEA